MSAGDLGCLLLCVRCESGRPLVFSSEAIGRSNASSLPAKPVAGRVLAFTKLSRAERGRQPDKRCFSAVAFAEFEEKSYEIAACGEFMRGLGGQIGHVFAPGQVLEARLGYDAAVSVSQRHPIWNVLQVPRPAGVRLLPTYWRGGKQPEAGRLPGALISLVVQFKRPEYLHAGTAAQWRYWREPYFRFARQTRQQRILRRLERAVGNDALVRYSAPAFWRWRDLEAAQLAGRVLEESGFVSPAALDRHSVWTYVQPGVDGRANPSGNRAHFSRLDQLGDWFGTPESGTDLTVADQLGEHLRVLANSAAAALPAAQRRNVERWLVDVAERVGDSADLEVVRSMAMMSTMVAEADATWWMVAR